MTEIQGALIDMAGSVASSAMYTLSEIIPALAPLIAAIIVASLGYSFVKRFSA